MRIRIATAVVGLLAAASPALAHADGHRPCSAEDPGGAWPSYGHDASNSRTQAAERELGPAEVGSLAPAWHVTTTGGLESTPVVSGGCVYVATTTGLVLALDAKDGHEVWRHQVVVATPGATGGAIVGAPAVDHGRLIVLISETDRPYALALDARSGNVLWRSAPMSTQPGSYTNAATAVSRGVVVAGWSPTEGSSAGQGGVALFDESTGATLATVFTVPVADQAKGYAGGGVWSTAAFDRDGYAYVGAGNPMSKTEEHPHTNAVLKIDVDRSRSTFGTVVASYKGNVDQYDAALQTASQLPTCSVSDTNTQWPLDDPVCGQLDLDFGASPNLMTDGSGHLLVGDLQKSGTYHVAHANDMSAAWSTLVGGTCQACNAASTAYDGASVYVEGVPGGALWSLDARTGARKWVAPVADGTHYQSISTADGVVWTIDGDGFLDAWSAADGSVLVKRPLSADVSAPTPGLASSGVAIADHTVFAATSDPSMSTGYLVAYRR
jgi:outer membrane protein assembly factor BamB